MVKSLLRRSRPLNRLFSLPRDRRNHILGRAREGSDGPEYVPNFWVFAQHTSVPLYETRVDPSSAFGRNQEG
jgi:hypothetical protein